MLMTRRVDPVDHRGERRGFAGACRPGHEDQPAGAPAQLGDDLWESQLLEALDLVWDRPEDRTNGLFLPKDIYTESREPLEPDREIEFLSLGEFTLLFVVQEN